MPRCYVGFVRVFALVCGVCMCLREVPYRFLMYPYVPYSVHRSFLNHPIRPIPLCVQRSFRHLGLGHKILETRTLWWTMWRCDLCDDVSKPRAVPNWSIQHSRRHVQIQWICDLSQIWSKMIQMWSPKCQCVSGSGSFEPLRFLFKMVIRCD